MKHIKGLTLLSSLALLTACNNDDNDKNKTAQADTVYQNGYIYTVDSNRSVQEAIALKSDEIIYVGSTQGAQEYISSDTQVVDLENRMMLPGLHDTHIHPTGIVDLDMCDLGVQIMDLDQLVAALEACKITYQYGPNDAISVLQWNSYTGNSPTESYSNLLSALDSVSSTQPIYLLGPDGHSGAANSYALAQVKNSDGMVVGLNQTTLANEFIEYAPFVGVDAEGSPNGYLTESAQRLAGIPFFLDFLFSNQDELPKIPEKLNKYGITSAQDAYTSKETVELYKTMSDNGDMTFRMNAALGFHVDDHVSDNSVNLAGIVSDLNETRSSLDNYPYLKAETVKIMIDGVQEGNPTEVPPTLPTSVMLEDFKQPIFDLSQLEQGEIGITGYVDTDSSTCQDTRNNPENYDELSEVEAFMATNSYHPAQCKQEKGEILGANSNSLLLKENGISTEQFLNNFVVALDQADFTTHMHAIGDGAVRAALDAIEQAKSNNPASELPHTIAHMQVVHPDDQQRMGQLGVYLDFTYAWMHPDYSYNLSVMPFVDELSDLSTDSMYSADNYYMQSVYPAKTAQDAGATLIAGSDAPVDTREPVPFVHIASGMTRAGDVEGQRMALNAEQVLSVHDMIAAYTINGAKAMLQDDLVGSIEVGKKADLIIVDQNIVQLAENNTDESRDQIAETQVLTTIFDGKVVYNAASAE